jgi:hypothetical protein
MLNPIKRIWVPKKAPVQSPAAGPKPTASPNAAPTAKPAGAKSALFDELPSPDMEEKNSDSVWAAFDSVHVPEIERK